MSITAPVIVAILAFAFSATLLVDRRASLWTIGATVAAAGLLAVELSLLGPFAGGFDVLLSGAVTLIACGGGLIYDERKGPRVVAAILIALCGLYFLSLRYRFLG